MIKLQGLFLGILMILIPILVLVTALYSIRTSNVKENIVEIVVSQTK